MNIAFNQLLSNTKLNVAKTTDVIKSKNANAIQSFKAEDTINKAVNVEKEVKESSKFGSVFDKVIASQKQSSANNTTTTDEQEVNLEEMKAILQTTSVEQLFDLLGIQHDDGLFMIQVDMEGKAVSIDEMLNIEDLLSALNIEQQQLTQTINELLGEDKQASDLWEFLSLVQDNAPLLLSQVAVSLQGEHKVTPKESQQLLQFLKLAELVGKQSDITSSQENNLMNIKNFLSQAAELLQKQPLTENTVKQQYLPGFNLSEAMSLKQQVIQSEQQSNQKAVLSAPVITQNVMTKSDTDTIDINVSQAPMQKVESFTLTLPIAKPAQSEAFLKEMQEILNKAQISNAAGLTKLAIKLYPENLGSIRIELTQQNGVFTARLLASTALGRELLDNHAHQLKQAFVQQNIQVERLDIAQSLQDAERNTRDQGFLNNFYKQQQQEGEEEQQDNNDDDTEKMSFNDYLISEGV